MNEHTPGPHAICVVIRVEDGYALGAAVSFETGLSGHSSLEDAQVWDARRKAYQNFIENQGTDLLTEGVSSGGWYQVQELIRRLQDRGKLKVCTFWREGQPQ